MFRRACYGILVLELLLGIAHFLWPDQEWGQGRKSLFNLGTQLSLGSWLIGVQLVAVAGLALAGAHRDRVSAWGWRLTALISLALSAAQLTRFHVRLDLLGAGQPEPYERMVLASLSLAVLVLLGWFVISRLDGTHVRNVPLAAGWLAGWGLALFLGHITPLSFPDLADMAGFGSAMGMLYGTTLLMLVVGERTLGAQPVVSRDDSAVDAALFDSGSSRIWILIGVGGMTFTVIFLQIVLFQMLTIFGDYITATTAISISLLGISIGGLIGFFTAARAPMATMIGAALLLPLTIVAALGTTVSYLDQPLLASLLLTAPFICCSTAITVALARASSHLVYCIDLLGAALGAFAVSPVLTLFREESSLLFLASFALLVAGCFIVALPTERRARGWLLLVQIVGLHVFVIVGTFNLKHDWLNVVRTNMERRYPELEVLFSRSSFVGRYDIIRTVPSASTLKSVENGRVIDTIRSRTADGYQIDPRVPHTLYDNPEILILGLSGDAITKTARFMSDRVTGIEINPVVVQLQSNELRELNGGSYEGIEVVAMDGRTFVEQTDTKFDIITLMNAHFAKGHVTGRAASPEYLQTREAFLAYLDSMTDRGIVDIEEPLSRPYRETQVWKLLRTMRQALIDHGSPHPEKHFFVFQWKSRRNNYFQILMKKTAFTDEDVVNLRRWLHDCDNLRALERQAGKRLGPIKAISTILYSPDEEFDTNVARLIEGRADPDFLRAHHLIPITDDKPFPFDVDPERLETRRSYHRTLAMMLLLLPFFGYFLIRRRTELGSALPFVSVVGLTGVAYLLIEIVLMQRYTILLGSPVVTFSTVLGSLMIFSGLGSLWSGRIQAAGLYGALGALFLMLILHITVMPGVMSWIAPLPLIGRVLCSVLSMAPLAFFMGVPFPFVLRAGKERFSESAAAMLFAINAATSALAVPLALNISTAWGMKQVLLVSLLIYVAVALSLIGAHRPRLLVSANLSATAILLLLLGLPWLVSRPVHADPASRADRYEVHSLSYGRSKFREDRVMVGGKSSERVSFNWQFWVVQGQERTVVVDTGFDDESLARRWKLRGYVQPMEQLARLAIDPAEVTDVVLTHAHWDHMGALENYTSATIWIQEDEYQHALSSVGPQNESRRGMRWEDFQVLLAAEEQGRVRRIDGDHEIAPGLKLTLGGAHTPGMQYVTVNTLDGNVILASDATYLYWNNRRHVPIGTAVDRAANLEAIREMHRVAASPFLIIPGHDPKVQRWFPEVAPGIVKITTEIGDR